MSDYLFYLFAALAVISAIFMVSARSAVAGAMGMIATLIAVAADYFLLDAPFLGVLQVLVYAGAVMVLFLFIVMLLDVDKAARTAVPVSRYVSGAMIFAILATLVVILLTKTGGLAEVADAAPAKPSLTAVPVSEEAGVLAMPAQPIAFQEDARSFGRGLFTKYMLPLQLAGFLLLAAMLAVVSLSKRPKA